MMVSQTYDENNQVYTDANPHPGHCSQDNHENQNPVGHNCDCGVNVQEKDSVNHLRDKCQQKHIENAVDEVKKKDNLLSKVCPHIDQQTLVPKAFYTFFYTGIGALFPYLPIYFKQLHLTPHQTGILIGVRPLIQFLATPIWGAIADRFCKGKTILLLSVLGWLVSNVLLAMVPESRHTRLCDYTMDYDPTMKELSDSVMLMKRSQFNVSQVGFGISNFAATKHDMFSGVVYTKNRSKLNVLQKSMEKLSNNISDINTRQQDQDESSKPRFDLVSRPWALSLLDSQESATYLLHDNITCNPKAFRFLLVVTVIGTLVSAPTHMMADTATLTSLDGALHNYGKVRLWGSLGWGVGGFAVGAAVSSNYATRCNGETIINYFPCFYVYAVAMGIAFLCATQFRYDSAGADEVVILDNSDNAGLKNAIKVFRSQQYCFVLVIAFYCGSATGFIETFLFWYLHELGGGQFLFSVVNGLNCAAEVLFFFVTDRLISYLGHVNIIYLALVCYALRFLYFYFLWSPWMVLPAELLQGITTAALWASCVSYIGLHPGASHTIQGILNGVYMGLGFAAGGFIGGGVVHLVGMRNAFLIYAIISVVLCLVFSVLNKCRGD